MRFLSWRRRTLAPTPTTSRPESRFSPGEEVLGEDVLAQRERDQAEREDARGVRGGDDPAERAGVQAPTLYHHFGSKRGLEDAVVTHGFKQFLAERERLGGERDPIDDIREGWDLHVRYGLENPYFYGLIYGRVVPGKPCGVVAASTGVVFTLITQPEGDLSLSDDVRDAVLARITRPGPARGRRERARFGARADTSGAERGRDHAPARVAAPMSFRAA